MAPTPTMANKALAPYSPERIRQIVHEVLVRRIESGNGFNGDLGPIAAEIALEIAVALPQHHELFWLHDVAVALRNAGIRPIETKEG